MTGERLATFGSPELTSNKEKKYLEARKKSQSDRKQVSKNELLDVSSPHKQHQEAKVKLQQELSPGLDFENPKLFSGLVSSPQSSLKKPNPNKETQKYFENKSK